MDKITFKFELITDKNIWEKRVLLSHPKTFLQSWNWGETNVIMGEEVKRYIVYKNNVPTALFQVIFQDAKRGKHMIIPGGPIVNWNDKRLVNALLKFIVNIARDNKMWFIRIRPDIFDNYENKNILKTHGFIPSQMHLHAENTWILDLTQSEEELLSGMRKNTRYNVKKSFNEGYVITKTNTLYGADILFNLQKETAKRHSFVEFPKKLFEAQLLTFAKDKQAVIYLCKKNNIILAAAIIIFYGESAYYHHSASSDEARNTNASYYMQWNIIKDAKAKGCKYYNFWGIAPEKEAPRVYTRGIFSRLLRLPVGRQVGEQNLSEAEDFSHSSSRVRLGRSSAKGDNRKHRFWGVTIFKKGFGGYGINWIHSHDLKISNYYWLTYFFEYARKIKRRLY